MTNAERQARHRDRHLITITAARLLTDELIPALDRGRCHRIGDNLPEGDEAMFRELTARLVTVRLVAHKLDPPS